MDCWFYIDCWLYGLWSYGLLVIWFVGYMVVVIWIIGDMDCWLYGLLVI